MTTNQIIKSTGEKEAVKSFVLPVKLTPRQKKIAESQLKEARQKTQDQATQSERLEAKLFQLKFQIEEYLAGNEFEQDKRFGNFLKVYLQILNKKRNVFAEEIKVHETLLSQLINNRRLPGDHIIIRLELHSSQMIPADYWFRLVEKERVHEIKTNRRLRTRERNYVSNKVRVQI